MSRLRLRGLRRKATRRTRFRRAVDDVAGRMCWLGTRWWARGVVGQALRSGSHALRR